jgi:hypothetical protein
MTVKFNGKPRLLSGRNGERVGRMKRDRLWQEFVAIVPPCRSMDFARLVWAIWTCLVLGGGLSFHHSQAAESIPALALHEHWLKGLDSKTPDPADVQAVFAEFFQRLPSEVTVFPSENYYYFQMTLGGRQLWGNLRLATGLREKGMASFAYAEFQDFPGFTTNRLVRTWMPGKSDGLTMTNTTPLEWHLGYRGKTVVFHLHPLRQEPPVKFTLGKDEQFVMRTFDESGYQFFLLFHRERPFFFWVLNEEETVPDTFEPVFEGFEAGRRSGFVFWVDRDHGNRRVLVAVRRASTVRNDYYDGPFDQLADNDADKTQVAEYIQKAYPITRGKIDKYGYWMNRKDYQRVGLACYGVYDTAADLLDFVNRARGSTNFLEAVGRAQDTRARSASTAPKK